MSYNHENVVWQSPDGTWNRGFYAEDYLTCGGNDDECGDETHEWCREFDQNTFQWVSAGHRSEDEAYRSWDGSNPGGSTSYRPYAEQSADGRADIARLEDMAAALCEREQARDRENPRRSSWSWGSGFRAYSGPPKTRSLDAVQAQRDAMLQVWVSHQLGGYANLLDPQEKDLTAQIDRRLATASPAEVEAYEARDAAHRDQMRTMIADHRRTRLERARQSYQNRWGGYHHDAKAAQRSREADARERAAEDYVTECDKKANNRAAVRTVAREAAAREAAAKATPPAAKKPAAKQAAPKPTTGTQGRVSKGVPTGGQFATSARAEADVSLAPAPTPAPAEKSAAPKPTGDPVKDSTDFADWGADPWA